LQCVWFQSVLAWVFEFSYGWVRPNGCLLCQFGVDFCGLLKTVGIEYFVVLVGELVVASAEIFVLLLFFLVESAILLSLSLDLSHLFIVFHQCDSFWLFFVLRCLFVILILFRGCLSGGVHFPLFHLFLQTVDELVLLC
jgi:hypothetical protein